MPAVLSNNISYENYMSMYCLWLYNAKLELCVFCLEMHGFYLLTYLDFTIVGSVAIPSQRFDSLMVSKWTLTGL